MRPYLRLLYLDDGGKSNLLQVPLESSEENVYCKFYSGLMQFGTRLEISTYCLKSWALMLVKSYPYSFSNTL